MAISCNLCQDVGLIRVERDGKMYTAPCSCQDRQRVDRRIQVAGIPKGFEHCSLENYQTVGEPARQKAALFARRFIEEYIPGARQGMLFEGSVGLGKTHLAVAIAKALIANKGVRVRFLDVPAFIQHMRRQIGLQQMLRKGRDVELGETETEILAEVWKSELVVLDDLGATAPSDYVMDSMDSIIRQLYNDPRPLLVTTNYTLTPDKNHIGLFERIGERMVSRIHELCDVRLGWLEGTDWRKRQHGDRHGSEVHPGGGTAPDAPQAKTDPGGTGSPGEPAPQQPAPLRDGQSGHSFDGVQRSLFDSEGRPIADSETATPTTTATRERTV